MIELYRIYKNITVRQWDTLMDCFELQEYFRKGVIHTEYDPRKFTLKIRVIADDLDDSDISYISDMISYRLGGTNEDKILQR